MFTLKKSLEFDNFDVNRGNNVCQSLSEVGNILSGDRRYSLFYSVFILKTELFRKFICLVA